MYKSHKSVHGLKVNKGLIGEIDGLGRAGFYTFYWHCILYWWAGSDELSFNNSKVTDSLILRTEILQRASISM